MIRRCRLGMLALVTILLTGGPALAQSKPPKPPVNQMSVPAMTPAPSAGPVQVSAAVDRTAIWVGDRVTYTIEITCGRGVEILLDDLAKEKLRLNGLEVLSSDSATTIDAAERTTYRLRYVLSTYRVDGTSLTIEPLSARYYERRPGQRLQDIAPAGEVRIPGAVVAFRSTLPEQPAYELRDGRAAAPRHPLLARAGSIGLALVVVSLAPAALVAVSLLRRRPRKAGRRSARQVRQDHRATLERLRTLDVATEQDRRRAYDEISAAVRQHLAATAGVPASGLTAPEVATALEAAGGRVSRESATSLLAAADEARYGPPRALPSAEACREALSTAEQVLGGR